MDASYSPTKCVLVFPQQILIFILIFGIVCEEPRFEDDVFDILLNPIVVVEVLSPSTEAYDRGDKFAHYRQLESLQEYILVAQDKVRVEHYVRHTAQWILTDFQELDQQLPLTSIQCELHLQEIYENVPFLSSTNT